VEWHGRARLNDSMIVRAWLSCCLALVGLLGLAGCSFIPSHIHNEAKASAARQARDAMAEYGKNAPKMYSSMLANVDRFKGEEVYLLAELAANASDSLVTKAPSMTWEELSKEITNKVKELDELKVSLGATAATTTAERASILAKAKSLEERVAAARAALKAAKEDVTSWNASIALIRDAIEQLPASSSSLNGSAALQDVQAAIEAAASRKIEFVDADGNTVTESVSDIVQKRIPGLLESLQEPGVDGSLLGKLPDAPGLQLVLATLGLELAQVEQRRAEVRLERIAQTVEVLDDAQVQIAVAGKLLRPAQQWVAEIAGTAPRSNAFESISRARLQARAVFPSSTTEPKEAQCQPVLSAINSASLTLVNLRDVVVGESILARVSNATPVALARIEHTRSIVESSINDRQYQALISSGLAGLVAYHEGGLTSEDVANVIRFVQAVAVGVLAGRVD
jgi:hypothetical protein